MDWALSGLDVRKCPTSLQSSSVAGPATLQGPQEEERRERLRKLTLARVPIDFPSHRFWQIHLGN